MTSKWQNYLTALAHARKQRDFQRAKAAPWFLLAIAVFIVAWLFLGIQIAMVSFFLSGVLIVSFSTQSKLFFNRNKVRNNSEATAINVERHLLQAVATDVAPWLQFRLDARSEIAAVTNSHLIQRKLDFVYGSRSLSGGPDGQFAITATYIEAGHYQHYKNSAGVKQRHSSIIYQGLFLSMRFPRAKAGWVVLDSDKLETLGWLAHEWRSAQRLGYLRMDNTEFEKYFHVSASRPQEGFQILSSHVMEALVELAQKLSLPISLTFRDGMMMALLPTKTNPFELRNNEGLWGNELKGFIEVAQNVASLCELLNSEKLKWEVGA